MLALVHSSASTFPGSTEAASDWLQAADSMCSVLVPQRREEILQIYRHGRLDVQRMACTEPAMEKTGGMRYPASFRPRTREYVHQLSQHRERRCVNASPKAFRRRTLSCSEFGILKGTNSETLFFVSFTHDGFV